MKPILEYIGVYGVLGRGLSALNQELVDDCGVVLHVQKELVETISHFLLLSDGRSLRA